MSEQTYGIVERIKRAETKTEKAKLLKEAKAYEHISAKTLRRCIKFAKEAPKPKEVASE
tara:strand:- start:1571 stop:1747 length:177 start_codon:yes stop_codon:yes gene_type:complete